MCEDNIDRLAKQGLRLTRCYNSRTNLLTAAAEFVYRSLSGQKRGHPNTAGCEGVKSLSTPARWAIAGWSANGTRHRLPLSV